MRDVRATTLFPESIVIEVDILGRNPDHQCCVICIMPRAETERDQPIVLERLFRPHEHGGLFSVHIGHRYTRLPIGKSGDSSLFRHLFKLPVSLVQVQFIFSAIAYKIQVYQSVIIHISGRNAAAVIKIQVLDDVQTIVVNDLVFTASLDGILYAMTRSDGRVVWKYQAPGGTNAWPAISGDTIVWPIGLGDKPLVLALKLGGNIIPPTPETIRTPVKTPEGG